MRLKSLFEKKSPWSEQANSSLIVLVLSLPLLFQVTYVPLSVLITTFKKENVKRPLEGFGVLVPSVEQQNGLKTLGNTRLFVLYRCKSGTLWSVCQLRFAGTLFSSMMFPDRAPSDLYLYTTFVGGSRNKELASASTWGSFNAPFFFFLSTFYLLFTLLIFFLLILSSYRDELKQVVTSDLRQLLGAEGEPTFVK